MTTSWSYATRGQLASALEAHVAGTLLAVAAAIGAAAALAVAVGGKWTLYKPSETALVTLLAVAGAIVACEWLVRLWND